MTQYQKKPDVIDAMQWDGTPDGFTALQAFGPVSMELLASSVYVPSITGPDAYLQAHDWLVKDYFGRFSIVRAADFDNLYQAV